jgi:hypothetical protein
MDIKNIKKPGLAKGSERTYETQDDAFIAEYGEKTGTRTKYIKPNNNDTKKTRSGKTELILVTGKSKYEPKIEKLVLKRRKE